MAVNANVRSRESWSTSAIAAMRRRGLVLRVARHHCAWRTSGQLAMDWANNAESKLVHSVSKRRATSSYVSDRICA